MSSEMTPREHDDMRDLLLAGAQRMRPADSYRRLVSVGVAVVVVAVVAGGVAVILGGRGAVDDDPAVAPTSAGPTLSPAPTPTMPPEWCEPPDFPTASLPSVGAPAPGEHRTLQRDPCLTAKSLLGSYEWLENQGIDADLIQGFESIARAESWLASVEPWTAPLGDGSGMCILLRADNRNGWADVACDAAGVPATVERVVDGAALRFVIENDAVVVYATSP